MSPRHPRRDGKRNAQIRKLAASSEGGNFGRAEVGEPVTRARLNTELLAALTDLIRTAEQKGALVHCYNRILLLAERYARRGRMELAESVVAVLMRETKR